MLSLAIEDFLESSKNNPVVDVRSPGEYSRGHIPGALNIPLFTDNERALIGTTFKQNSREKAIKEGLDIVGPKMSNLVNRCSQLKFRDHLLIHCWRGGMRSESFAWLINTAGLTSATLKKGYKAYRNHALNHLEKPAKILLIAGSTGGGKTEILHKLKDLGEQIIDLEELAHHKGSVFGALGQAAQPTTELFQNKLFQAFQPLDLNKRIWMEDESIAIGRVFIPGQLWGKMRASPFIRVELAREKRAKRLVAEYGAFGRDQLADKITMIGKRLGGQMLKQALFSLHKGDLESTANIALNYYDKAYNNSIDRKQSKQLEVMNYDSFNAGSIAKKLIKTANKFSKNTR